MSEDQDTSGKEMASIWRVTGLILSRSAMSSSKPPPPTSAEEAELDKLLSREASALQREVEVERILKAFKLKYAV